MLRAVRSVLYAPCCVLYAPCCTLGRVRGSVRVMIRFRGRVRVRVSLGSVRVSLGLVKGQARSV